MFKKIGLYFSGAIQAVKNFFHDTPKFYMTCGLTIPMDCIKPASVILFRTNGAPIGYIIREGEKISEGGKPWAGHACIYKGPGTKGEHTTIEAEAQGVVYDNLEASMTAKDQFIIFYNPTATDLQRDNILKYADSTVGKPYNYEGDAAFVLPWIHPKQGAEFCSQDTDEAAAFGGMQISDRPANKTSPNNILRYMVRRGMAQGWQMVGCYNVNWPALRTAVLAGTV